ncbi:BcCHSVII, class VII chitin synthase [Polyplosphaeria fusca]|uniref:chitin synthase n=1 Tax=Polyplosphaeria fusca TaxID=682080 RepID=A0A9P4V0G8_9PLEO|nr:BcCHSVII, class VII chitin synthase [Polyplosphaeria fusca]
MVWQQAGALLARAADENGVIAITDKWPTKDIVYVAIIGTVMLAALLEWFLWLAAFLYCLVKVFQKAENWSVRILSVLMMILFTAFRAIFLPIMVVTLPLPPQVTKYFPSAMVDFLQWFAFWAFAGLLTIPWLFCVYQLVVHSIGRTKRIKTVLDEASAPKVVIVMPCYKEIPDILLRTVDSLVDCDYPPSCLHIFLSFDGDQEDELYLNTIEKLGVPLTLDSYPKSIDVTYRSCRITVSRFPHGGKRHCQKRTYKLIDKIYAEYLKRNDNLFVLFIDSDCILDKVCIQNFVYEMELKPGSKKNMLAMTGVITSTTEKNSLITILQDMEYIHGQLFERSVESGCGAVTCLPGALTILRFSAFRKMAKYYFADKAEQCDDLFDYGKCHLGEDRWLTHLFMIGAQERYQIQMNTGAFCKTEAVQTYRSLLKQRRRWFLGFITNEVCMLTDARLWRRYPLLCLVRFMQNTIRTTALLFFIMVVSIITTSQKIKNLPVGFIAISLGLNWLLMLYFGAKLGRYKIMMYPIMFIINPFFNWLYMVYGIFTAGQRTWGGPRADAGTADTSTTPAQAIEQAEATGDDLNVVPETFKAATEAKKQNGAVPLMPSDHLEGRFAPAERLPGGWYQQTNDSGLHLPNMQPRDLNDLGGLPHQRRTSLDSMVSGTSAGNSVYLPRRVESIMDPEDARMYHKTQANQKPAGGAYYEADRQMQSPYQISGNSSNPKKAQYYESVESLSDDSVYNGRGRRDPNRPPHTRGDSEQSLPSAGNRTPGANSPLSTEFTNALEIPKASHARPGHRDSSPSHTSANRTGRSPLARQSFVRTAGANQELGFEMQQQQQQRSLMRDVSPAPETQPTSVYEPSHQRSESRDSDKKRRNRLTKNAPGSGK